MERTRVIGVAVGMVLLLAVLASPLLMAADPETVGAREFSAPNAAEDYTLESRFEAALHERLTIGDGELHGALYHEEVRHDAGNVGVRRRGFYEPRSPDHQFVRATEYTDLSASPLRSYTTGEAVNSDRPVFEDCQASNGTMYRVEDTGASYNVRSLSHGPSSLDSFLEFAVTEQGNTTVYTPQEGVHREQWGGKHSAERPVMLVRVPEASGSMTVTDGRLTAADVRAEVQVVELVGGVVVPGVSGVFTGELTLFVERETRPVTVEPPAWVGEECG